MRRRGSQILPLNCLLMMAIPALFSCSHFQWSEKQVEGKELPRQYKKAHRPIIAAMADGNYDEAIAELEAYLQSAPDDPESLYCLAIAYANTKHGMKKARKVVERSLETELEFERFLAGPRDLTKPLVEAPFFTELKSAHNRELLHGPVLGCVTDHSAKFWVRTAHEVDVQVLVSREVRGVKQTVSRSPIVKTNEERDFTAVIPVDDLEPNTEYDYELLVDLKRQPQAWRFRTFPLQGQSARFQVGFGGGAGFTPQHERMWDTIASHRLPAFLLLGDNVYIDNPTRRQVQQYCYYRRQSRPEYRRFAAATSVFAIWDDHDFTVNDGRGGPAIDDPPWKRPVWRVFRDNWNNPYYGGGEANPGCWFDTSIADVDFFFLDGRYYRENPKAKNASMLGPVQKQWLFEKLRNSKATFKVLASPVPWAIGTKPGSRDTWDGYAQEREEIFSFIERNRIDGIVLISADRHRSDIWKIERPNGYDFYEFESSKLTNVHTHKIIKGSIFGYNEKCSFGLLTFDTTRPDPEVAYRIYDIDNELIHTHTVRLSQLTHSK